MSSNEGLPKRLKDERLELRGERYMQGGNVDVCGL